MELVGWLDVAEKHKLLLDSEDLKHIEKTCIFLLRNTTNTTAMRESCGESLKLVIKRTVSDLQASQGDICRRRQELICYIDARFDKSQGHRLCKG